MNIVPARLDPIILRELIRNDEFMRRTLPFFKPDYFDDPGEKEVFEAINAHIEKYNAPPIPEILRVNFTERGIDQDAFNDRMKIISGLENEIATAPVPELKWLIDSSEQFCKRQAMSNAILRAYEMAEDKSETSYGKILQLMTDAMAVSFDVSVGHDFYEDAEKQWDFYQSKENKIPFNLGSFNQRTEGGIGYETLCVVMAGTGVGKSLFLCHHAAHCLLIGKKVLYITLELSEPKVRERIDENLMKLTRKELHALNKEEYLQEIERLKGPGALQIKRYPTTSAHVGHFRGLISELWMKKQFKPDVIMIDYLNICASSRFKSVESSYGYVKAIAEELRGLAGETGAQVWTATQVNRGGYNSSDLDLTNTSESMGAPFTADFYFALIETDEFKEAGKLLVNILKDRDGDAAAAHNKRFMIGVDKSRMTLYDLEDEAQSMLYDSEISKNRASAKPSTGGMKVNFSSPDDADDAADAAFKARLRRASQIVSDLAKTNKSEMKWS